MKLSTKHLFPFIKMINKLNVKHEIKEFFVNKLDITDKSEEEKEQLTKERGLDLVFVLLEKLPNAEKEVFYFLALYSGKSVEEIESQEIQETIDMLLALFKDKAFSSFFTQATK
jgi:hypothetical protein